MAMNLQDMIISSGGAIKLLKAVSNERRLQILCYLQQGELSVGELNEELKLSQSALSQHLALLRRYKLVKTRKEAQTVFYRLDSNETEALIALLHQLYGKKQPVVAH